MGLDLIVFLIALIPIPILVLMAKRASSADDEFGGRTYGRVMVGLSAAATGNSGFIMTGAVGLGYAYGAQWILLPLSWLVGDLVFWKFGPRKINSYCSRNNYVNVAQIVAGNDKRLSPIIYAFTSLLLVVLLGAYISSQWIAGSKIISGFMEIDVTTSIIGIGVFVTGYCMIGKFRGSVYTDLYQGALMIFVTLVALYLAITFDTLDKVALPKGFESLAGQLSATSLVAFILGYAVASIGFGFSQPQIVSRYIAAKNSEEAASAKWIYILFLQFTWIGMTYFGMLLKTKGFVVEDPEGALVPFFHLEGGDVLTGLAVAGIFAAIASTVDSIVVSITSLIKNRHNSIRASNAVMEVLAILAVGIFTVVVAINIQGSVFAIALLAISMVGATLGGPVIIRLYSLKHTDISIFAALMGGGIAGYLWRSSEYAGLINEAIIGILISVIINYSVVFIGQRSGTATNENV